jgi:hypothetical protein
MLLACWPRLLNHACGNDANIELRSNPLDTENPVPGFPNTAGFKKVVYEIYTTHNVEMNQELLLNYLVDEKFATNALTPLEERIFQCDNGDNDDNHQRDDDDEGQEGGGNIEGQGEL